MAVYVHDKTQQLQYLQRCLQSFLWDCGRNTAILNSTILQSDQDNLLITILKATALAFGGNMQVRQKPAYSSQSQGSVERYHATLAAQSRRFRAQVEKNYNVIIGARHPITPWIVRNAAYLMNRYAVHSDGMTSYSRRWNKEHRTPLCEFSETVQYMIQDVRLQGKLEQRFFTGIWLGKDTHTNESVLGIPGKIVKARTVRRQVAPEKYNKQLLTQSASTHGTPQSAQWQHQPLCHCPEHLGQHQHKQQRGGHRQLRSRKHWMHPQHTHHRA